MKSHGIRDLSENVWDFKPLQIRDISGSLNSIFFYFLDFRQGVTSLYAQRNPDFSLRETAWNT